MRGRQSQPTALKLLKGVKNRRINRNEPVPRGPIRKPAFVKGYRPKLLWKKYAPELTRTGVLKSTDVDMFGAWCCLMAQFQESPNDFDSARISQLRALASSFGLEPSSRSRIRVPEKREDDTEEKYFQ